MPPAIIDQEYWTMYFDGSLMKKGARVGLVFVSPLRVCMSVDRISSAVHRGVSRDGRFVGGGTRNQEPDGDTRRRGSDLDRFGSSDRHNTLRSVSLVYYIDLDDQVA